MHKVLQDLVRHPYAGTYSKGLHARNSVAQQLLTLAYLPTVCGTFVVHGGFEASQHSKTVIEVSAPYFGPPFGPWRRAPCVGYRRCQRVGTDCPAAWGMPEVHGEGIRSERRFGRGGRFEPERRLFGRFCCLAVPAMRDSVVEWAR